MIIEGQSFTGWVDYDRQGGKLDALSFLGKVTYFEFRVNKILVYPLEEVIKAKILKHLDNNRLSIMLGFTTLVCCGIEAIGTFYNGADGTYNTFKSFVEKYMNKKWQKKRPKKYDSQRHLYLHYLRENYRNGLAHGFTVKGGGIEGHRRNLPYINETTNGLQVNQYKLFNDFKNGFKKYCSDSRNAGEHSIVGRKFITRFEKVFIKGT